MCPLPCVRSLRRLRQFAAHYVRRGMCGRDNDQTIRSHPVQFGHSSCRIRVQPVSPPSSRRQSRTYLRNFALTVSFIRLSPLPGRESCSRQMRSVASSHPLRMGKAALILKRSLLPGHRQVLAISASYTRAHLPGDRKTGAIHVETSFARPPHSSDAFVYSSCLFAAPVYRGRSLHRLVFALGATCAYGGGKDGAITDGGLLPPMGYRLFEPFGNRDFHSSTWRAYIRAYFTYIPKLIGRYDVPASLRGLASVTYLYSWQPRKKYHEL